MKTRSRKRNTRRSTTLKLALGLAAIAAAFSLRGVIPELYRYVRIRRM